ncbi:hypothetical protein ATK36_0542 [Amycolatopsis sulphurea]|uniref:Uncharacterized protein n=1 Tax=Amycolatopsis sulphurea TaxID=76022 RepID=A0A2A9FZU3_9PSEU|nr:hypothetical protein [Amycolatopsis sulphurea]PFG56997.1 hypothetical protein ATK36_0542 [Amycolatopsis sulphurea]
MLQKGFGYGLGGDGDFVYLDTLDRYGVIVEAIEVPAVRRPSEVLRHEGVTLATAG